MEVWFGAVPDGLDAVDDDIKAGVALESRLGMRIWLCVRPGEKALFTVTAGKRQLSPKISS